MEEKVEKPKRETQKQLRLKLKEVRAELESVAPKSAEEKTLLAEESRCSRKLLNLMDKAERRLTKKTQNPVYAFEEPLNDFDSQPAYTLLEFEDGTTEQVSETLYPTITLGNKVFEYPLPA